MLTKAQQREIERREGNPMGTYFAVGVMILLLVMVGLYMLSENTRQIIESPAVENIQPIPNINR